VVGIMSTEIVTFEKKAEIVNRIPIRKHTDSTRPVSFLIESEVPSMVETARTMRDGERDYLLVMGVRARLFVKGGRG
jgi:hypothetical protein